MRSSAQADTMILLTDCNPLAAATFIGVKSKSSLYFWEMELSSFSIKKFLIPFYISGNRTPKKLFIFQKV